MLFLVQVKWFITDISIIIFCLFVYRGIQLGRPELVKTWEKFENKKTAKEKEHSSETELATKLKTISKKLEVSSVCMYLYLCYRWTPGLYCMGSHTIWTRAFFEQELFLNKSFFWTRAFFEQELFGWQEFQFKKLWPLRRDGH